MARLAAMIALSAPMGGCYHYAVAARGPGPNFDQLPIDRQNPQTSFQWSYLWGLYPEALWSPLQCTNGEADAAGNCLHGTIDPCHGKGIGFYETMVPAYGMLLTLVTLGTVAPIRVTFYCSTYVPAQSGPQDNGGPPAQSGPQ